MFVLMMTQKGCRCGNEKCPGFEDDILMSMESATDVEHAVKEEQELGNRVIFAVPAQRVMGLTQSILQGSLGAGVRVIGFPTHPEDFYLDPSCDIKTKDN
jgi:hypothetical protein